MRNQFVNSQEIILVWRTNEEHYTDETIKTLEHAAYHADTGTWKFFRVNRDWRNKSWTFEDVTEEVAQYWLDEHGKHPDEMNVQGYGPWIEDSHALSDYISEWEDEPSDFEEHNTLNHAQQGLLRRW